MRSSKIFILIGVALFIFGSAALCSYLLFVRPYSSFHLFHLKQAAVKKAPVSDQDEIAFNAAVALQRLQSPDKLEETITAWKAWLQAYPNSKKQTEALSNLGQANFDLLRSPSTAGGKESYIVVKGDSLDRIANKKKSNAELIQQVNALPNINLKIGQELFIPQLQMTITLDREKKLLTLENGGQFFKSYPLLSSPLVTKSKETTTLIADKIVMNGNKRVAFGDKKYPTGERIILLRSYGNIVAAPSEMPSAAPTTTDGTTNSTAPSPAAMPPGFVISASDMIEIFPLVNKATPVSLK